MFKWQFGQKTRHYMLLHGSMKASVLPVQYPPKSPYNLFPIFPGCDVTLHSAADTPVKMSTRGKIRGKKEPTICCGGQRPFNFGHLPSSWLQSLLGRWLSSHSHLTAVYPERGLLWVLCKKGTGFVMDLYFPAKSFDWRSWISEKNWYNASHFSLWKISSHEFAFFVRCADTWNWFPLG